MHILERWLNCKCFAKCIDLQAIYNEIVTGIITDLIPTAGVTIEGVLKMVTSQPTPRLQLFNLP